MNKTFKGPTREQTINFWKRYFEYHGDPIEEQKEKQDEEDSIDYHRYGNICHHCGHQLRRG